LKKELSLLGEERKGVAFRLPKWNLGKKENKLKMVSRRSAKKGNEAVRDDEQSKKPPESITEKNG